MKDEIIEKIERIIIRIISARGRSLSFPLTESEVQHFFVLVRKLIEKVSKSDKNQYALINFYCDWTVHSKIDRSKEGAKILTQIHEIIFEHLKKKDNSTLASELTSALSFDLARVQLNKLISRFGGKNDIVEPSFWNKEILPILAEIISKSPLRIKSSPRFFTMIQYIRSKPLKRKSVVEEIAIVKIPKKIFYSEKGNDEIIFFMLITTTDTTKFLAPLEH